MGRPADIRDTVQHVHIAAAAAHSCSACGEQTAANRHGNSLADIDIDMDTETACTAPDSDSYCSDGSMHDGGNIAPSTY